MLNRHACARAPLDSDAGRAGKVDRVAMFGGGGGDWRSADNPDKAILEAGGAHTFYSSQLERLPPEPGKQ